MRYDMTSRSVSRRLGCVVVGVAAMLASTAIASAPSFAEDAAKTDSAKQQDEWPCVYRKVPVLSAATIWDGPPITDTTSWHNDEAIRKLSEYVVSRRVKEDDANAAIKKYAASLPADTRDAKLTELFSAVLTRTNEDRKVVMNGIVRFHERQVERSKEIEKEAMALQPEQQAAAESPVEGAGLADQGTDAEVKYKWEVRAFQEKQANIPLACEIPQLIDERAGDVARAIRAEMKS